MRVISTETKIKPIESKKIQFSIRYKLLLIVSLIIILGLSSIILLVTIFYKSNSEILIQEYNLSLARLAGIQVESNLKNTSYRMQAFYASILQKNISEKDAQEKANQFFIKNPRFLFIGIAKKTENIYKFLFEFIVQILYLIQHLAILWYNFLVDDKKFHLLYSVQLFYLDALPLHDRWCNVLLKGRAK